MRAQESEENTFALIGLSNNSGVVWGSPLPDGRVKFCADGEGLACWGGVGVVWKRAIQAFGRVETTRPQVRTDGAPGEGLE